MKLYIQKNQLIALALCFYVFVFTVPYFVWFKPWIFGYSAFLIYILGLAVTINRWRVDNGNYFVLILYSIFCIFTFIPLRQHDSLDLSFLIPLASIFILLYNRDVADKALKIITNIFFIISLASLVSIVLYALSMVTAITTVTVPGRVFDTYDVFYGTVVIPTQYFEIFGLKVFRNHGWFQEPGHFAVYLSFVLALQKNVFSGIKNRVMLLALFSTFSAAGFLMFFVVVLFNLRLSTKLLIVLVVTTVVIFITYTMYLNNIEFQNFVDYWFLRKLEGGNDGIVAGRRAGYVDESLFNNDLLVIFGYGSEFLKNQGVILSDYMAHVYKYGLISIFPLLVLWSYLFYISFKTKDNSLKVVVLLSLLTFLHRSFMTVQPIFIFFTWLALMQQFESRRIDLNLKSQA